MFKTIVHNLTIIDFIKELRKKFCKKLVKLNLDKIGRGNMTLNILDEASRFVEPKRKDRWFLAFNDIPTDGRSQKQNDLAFVAATAARPAITFNQVETHRLNDKFYWAGKPTWNELPTTFYDLIYEANSATQIIWKWKDKVHYPITGQMGFKRNYTASSGMLALLSPEGEIAEKWFLFNVWPASVDHGDLSSEDDGVAMVTVTWRYDYAIHEDEELATPSTVTTAIKDVTAIENAESPSAGTPSGAPPAQ